MLEKLSTTQKTHVNHWLSSRLTGYTVKCLHCSGISVRPSTRCAALQHANACDAPYERRSNLALQTASCDSTRRKGQT